jgi:hypothetical protein
MQVLVSYRIVLYRQRCFKIQNSRLNTNIANKAKYRMSLSLLLVSVCTLASIRLLVPEANSTTEVYTQKDGFLHGGLTLNMRTEPGKGGS